MRFIILVRASAANEAGAVPADGTLRDEMSRYHAELARAGALLDASALQPRSRGWRIRYEGDRAILLDGPFIEATDLVAAYTIIEVSSREEAMEWTRRFPHPGGSNGEIEVRPLLEQTWD